MKHYTCFGDEIYSIDIKKKTNFAKVCLYLGIGFIVGYFILMGLSITVGLELISSSDVPYYRNDAQQFNVYPQV